MNLSKNHAHMGKIMQATRVTTPGMEPRRARIIILLAICTALQMTSYGMICPNICATSRRMRQFTT